MLPLRRRSPRCRLRRMCRCSTVGVQCEEDFGPWPVRPGGGLGEFLTALGGLCDIGKEGWTVRSELARLRARADRQGHSGSVLVRGTPALALDDHVDRGRASQELDPAVTEIEAAMIGDSTATDVDRALCPSLFHASAHACADVELFFEYFVEPCLFDLVCSKDRVLPTYCVRMTAAQRESSGISPRELAVCFPSGACEALECGPEDLRQLVLWLHLSSHRGVAAITHCIGAREKVEWKAEVVRCIDGCRLR